MHHSYWAYAVARIGWLNAVEKQAGLHPGAWDRRMCVVQCQGDMRGVWEGSWVCRCRDSRLKALLGWVLTSGAAWLPPKDGFQGKQVLGFD